VEAVAWSARRRFFGGVSDDLAGLDQIVGREPTTRVRRPPWPTSAGRLLDSLRDDTLRRVALLKMEGYGNAQIAAQLSLRAQDGGAQTRGDPQALVQQRSPPEIQATETSWFEVDREIGVVLADPPLPSPTCRVGCISWG